MSEPHFDLTTDDDPVPAAYTALAVAEDGTTSRILRGFATRDALHAWFAESDDETKKALLHLNEALIVIYYDDATNEQQTVYSLQWDRFPESTAQVLHPIQERALAQATQIPTRNLFFTVTNIHTPDDRSTIELRVTNHPDRYELWNHWGKGKTRKLGLICRFGDRWYESLDSDGHASERAAATSYMRQFGFIPILDDSPHIG